MGVLIISATKMEVPFVGSLLQEGTDRDLVITGVGAAVTVYQLVKAIGKKRPAMIIQAGIAGSFNANLHPGAVVAVESDCFGDTGVWENGTWRSLFNMGFVGPDEQPFTGGWLQNTHADLLAETRLPIVRGVTVNEISTRESSIEYYRGGLKASIETMEGGALHYVALMEDIPFLQIRAISNLVGERDKAQWKTAQAIQSLHLVLKGLLKKLS